MRRAPHEACCLLERRLTKERCDMVKLQGVSFIRVDGEDFPASLFLNRFQDLVEPWTTVAAVFGNLPITIITTMGTILNVTIGKFPYPSAAERLTAYGVQIIPSAGRILRVERSAGFVNHGVVSDLTCTPDRVGFTDGTYCHAEIYYQSMEVIPPVMPPSWLNAKTPAM